MEQALDAHTRKTSTRLTSRFWSKSLEVERRLEIERGEIGKVEGLVWLEQGNVGKKSRIRLNATQELEIIGIKGTETPTNYHGMDKPKCYYIEYGDINPRIYHTVRFSIKAPDQEGTYVMSYLLQCEGFTSDEVFLQVVVVK